MNAIDLIRFALTLSEGATARIAADLRDAPMTNPTPGAKTPGNHPVWTLGHLCVIEGSVPHILLGRPDPVAHWRPMFGTGSQPKYDASAYPPFDELLQTYRDLRAKNLALLEEIGEEGLDRVPANIPPGFEDVMTSFGQTLLLVALHNMVHYGQIADARRAAGLKPMM